MGNFLSLIKFIRRIVSSYCQLEIKLISLKLTELIIRNTKIKVKGY